MNGFTVSQMHLYKSTQNAAKNKFLMNGCSSTGWTLQLKKKPKTNPKTFSKCETMKFTRILE